MNVIDQIDQEQIAKLSAVKDIPEFSPGDSVKVHLRVVEGTRERIQIFEGVCIARRNAGINSSFTVRCGNPNPNKTSKTTDIYQFLRGFQRGRGNALILARNGI